MTMRAQRIAKLRSKEYRDAFVGSQISVGLPFQIRALREQRGWKQSDLVERTGMLQPRISAMESPGGTKFTLETLRRLASAFDVALMVRFVPFSELLQCSDEFNPDTFAVPSFAEDAALHAQKPEPRGITAPGMSGKPGLPFPAAKQDNMGLGNLIYNNTARQALAEQPTGSLPSAAGGLR